MEVARKCQKLVFGAYRPDQYTDPEAFMTQVAAVFSQHEDATLLHATNPLNANAIQRKRKWPPTISELSDDLDAAAEYLKARRFVVERESRGFFFKDGVFINAQGEKYLPEKHANLPAVSDERAARVRIVDSTGVIPLRKY